MIPALLAGCAPPANLPSASDQQRLALEEPARVLHASGRIADSARAYLRAAEQAPPLVAAQFRVRAAEYFLDVGETGSALRALAPDAGKTLPIGIVNRHYMVRAGVALADGDVGASIRALDRVKDLNLESEHAARFYGLQAKTLELSNDPFGALRALTKRSAALPSGSQAQQDNDEAIWALLQKTPLDLIRDKGTSPPETASGWLELRKLAANHAGSAELFDAAIQSWQRAYPGHPANAMVLPRITQTIRDQTTLATKVALFVPLSGDFAAAGQAIRDGFVTAWELDRGNPQRPLIDSQDTEVIDIASAYSAVIAQGVDFVVGPVRKPLASALFQSGVITVPTLLLNEIDQSGDLTANIEQLAPSFQFSLSAEGEAREIARKAFSDGFVRAATLVPASEWGDRVEAGFVKEWRSLGGVTVSSVRIPEEAEALSDVIKELLGLAQSEARYERLRNTLRRRIAHQPMPRADIDVLFLAAFPDVARQVMPLLLFHRADYLPVYATSHVYSGRLDPERDQDIEGLIFGDMPWILRPPQTPVAQRIRANWPNAPDSMLRLYAFGADAYELVHRVRALQASSNDGYPGMSGYLTVDQDGRVRRELSFAKFAQGIAQPLAERPGETR